VYNSRMNLFHQKCRILWDNILDLSDEHESFLIYIKLNFFILWGKQIFIQDVASYASVY
jgi:hypothetical protein